MTDDYAGLTPTEELFIEVLAGRKRTGESYWTFSSRVRRTANRLEDKGLVWTMNGIVERTFRAGLTVGGEKLCLDPSYTPPGPRHKVPGGEFGPGDSFPRPDSIQIMPPPTHIICGQCGETLPVINAPHRNILGDVCLDSDGVWHGRGRQAGKSPMGGRMSYLEALDQEQRVSMVHIDEPIPYNLVDTPTQEG